MDLMSWILVSTLIVKYCEQDECGPPPFSVQTPVHIIQRTASEADCLALRDKLQDAWHESDALFLHTERQAHPTHYLRTTTRLDCRPDDGSLVPPEEPPAP